jgi:hypothetical protein
MLCPVHNCEVKLIRAGTSKNSGKAYNAKDARTSSTTQLPLANLLRQRKVISRHSLSRHGLSANLPTSAPAANARRQSRQLLRLQPQVRSSQTK